MINILFVGMDLNLRNFSGFTIYLNLDYGANDSERYIQAEIASELF